MRKIILFISLSIVSVTYSQIIFENGYYIDNNGQKINCLIKNKDWFNNPEGIDIKQDSLANSFYKSINDIKEFGISNKCKYVRASVNIDTSATEINGQKFGLTYNKRPQWKQEIIFLKVLIDSKACLFVYTNAGIDRFFYRVDSAPIKQLIYKKYLNENLSILENKTYLGQLNAELQCEDESKLKNIKYQSSDLIKYFLKYNSGKGMVIRDNSGKGNELKDNSNKGTVVLNYSKKGDYVFHFKIVSGINYSSIDFSADNYKYKFNASPTILFGVEGELITPIDKNRWSVFINPEFNYYKSKVSSVNYGTNVNVNVDYKFINIPLGVRYYYYFSKNSRINVEASYFVSFPFNTELSRNYTSGISYFNISGSGSFALGLGYNYDKFGFEIKYYFKRELLEGYMLASATFENISFQISYTLF